MLEYRGYEMKMLKTMLLTAFMIVFFIHVAGAEKVILVDLLVNQDDTVTEKTVEVTDGRYSQYYGKAGDYALEFLDKDGKILSSQNINMAFGYTGPVALDAPIPDDRLFDTYFLSYKHPCKQEIKTVELRHFDWVIFSRDIDCADCMGIKRETSFSPDNTVIIALAAFLAFAAIVYYRKRNRKLQV